MYHLQIRDKSLRLERQTIESIAVSLCVEKFEVIYVNILYVCVCAIYLREKLHLSSLYMYTIF